MSSDSHVVAMPAFALVLRVIIMVLSLIILGLAANSIAGSSPYDSYSYYSYGGYSLISTPTMGFVLFLVSRSRAD